MSDVNEENKLMFPLPVIFVSLSLKRNTDIVDKVHNILAQHNNTICNFATPKELKVLRPSYIPLIWKESLNVSFKESFNIMYKMFRRKHL